MRAFWTKMLIKISGVKLITAGVPAIIKNSRGEILLGKRSRKVFYSGFWGLPGGVVEYGESLRNAVKREVKEEMDIDIQIIKQGKNAYESFPNKYSKLHSIDIPFHAKIISGIPKPKDETKEVKWFKPAEIKKMKLAYRHKEILRGEGLI